MSDIHPLGISPDLDPDDMESIGTLASARQVDPRDRPQPNTWAPEHGDLPDESPFRQPDRAPVGVQLPIQTMPGAYRILHAEHRRLTDAGMPATYFGLRPSRPQQAQHIAYLQLTGWRNGGPAVDPVVVQFGGSESAMPSQWAEILLAHAPEGGATFSLRLDGLPGLWLRAPSYHSGISSVSLSVLVVGI